ncbi:MAG: Hsp70 family protein [Phaeospirillum sp.]|nr:Hsp70 family protein [Phaeospirillum sp.]
MTTYVGIDLGTTNSAICSFDGENVRLYKNPEQGDVTPSAIFFDRRGNKYVGARAYNDAPRNPGNAATLFKRMMGTSTPVKLTSVNRVMTPEECSAEILRVLFGYLPEEMRNASDVGTVITVPAAFNAMQRQATTNAAEMADIGKVALMQEPVAAVMAVMRSRRTDGMFLIYDLGGGTLDIALAESINGRVNLLSHGGIEMCGGRDFDRGIVDNVVKPWLRDQFDLPEDFVVDPQYSTLVRMAAWAAEKAKIALSSRDDAVITLDESQIGLRDRAGTEMYLDVPFDRSALDRIIADKVEESVKAARDTLEKAGLDPNDIERVVFVGGPTHYKPLRDKVAFELGIAASTDVDPMTAVAEGAAVFAESIDWSSQSRGRKSSRGSISAGGSLQIGFSFLSRVPDNRTKILAVLKGQALPGAEFQIDSLDTGWSSGRMPLRDGAAIDVPLGKPGENVFKVFVFDASGGAIVVENDRIAIARTAASIDAIPASHSIGVEIRERIGGRPTLDYLVMEGDRLPKKGKKIYKAEESLKAGSADSLRFKLWEGEIRDPVTDNRFVGMFEVRGNEFEDGVIPAGADLICHYEVRDSGEIDVEVEVPCISGSFKNPGNFYSYQEGQIDYTKAGQRIVDEAAAATKRVEEISAKVDDPRLAKAREKLENAARVGNREGDAESAKKAMDEVQEAKRLLALSRKDNLKTIRQMELDSCRKFFDGAVRQYAKPSEETAFDNLAITAQRAIDSGSAEFESHLSDLRSKNFDILWRQDWFVVDRFRYRAQEAHLYVDAKEHAALVVLGEQAIKDDDMRKLREVVWRLDVAKVGMTDEGDMLASSNILKG